MKKKIETILPLEKCLYFMTVVKHKNLREKFPEVKLDETPVELRQEIQ